VNSKFEIPKVVIPPIQPAENEQPGGLEIPLLQLKGVQPAEDEPAKKGIIELTGKLITAERPVAIGKNFRSLKNMRYSDIAPKAVAGMTKINTTPGTYLKTRSAFNFIKPGPESTESHTMAQRYNTGLTASKVYDLTTMAPGTGDFTTDLWSDNTGAGIGRFSYAPDSSIIYCNGVDTCIWGGDESRCARFLNFDPAGSYLYDFTDQINNTKEDDDNIALFSTAGGGIDSNTMLLLHLDNNVTDSSPTTAHTVTNVGVTFTTDPAVFSYSGVFGGAAYLTIPDNADFDFSDGTWTIDYRGRLTDLAAVHPIYYQKTDLTKISFTNGEHAPVVGETVTGAVSGSTGIVDYVDVDSGAWGTSDAAGTLYMHSTTGDWDDDDENIKDPSDNVCAVASSVASDAGDNYLKVFVDTSGKINVLLHECYGAGSDVLSITCDEALSVETFYHIEVVENGSAWYVFVDGQLKYYTSSAERPKNYISVVYIGYDGSTYLKGHLDEFRVSNLARHVSSFTPGSSAYSAATVVANVYVGSVRPLKGWKPYIKTANGSTAAAAGYEWTGSTWSALSLTDGTADTGKTLAKTGTVSFSSTVATAKPKYIDGTLLYFYWFTFTGIDTSTSIYHVTVDAPFQQIVDIWDGADRIAAACYKYTTTYTDYALNIYENDYWTTDASSYADLSSLGAFSGGSNCFLLGFFERVTAVSLGVPSDATNSTANTICSVDVWDGAQFTSVGVIDDGTSEGGVSLSKSGTISWAAPEDATFFKKTIANNTTPLYYVRLRWNQTLDASTRVYYASGIPTAKKLYGYKFSMYAQDRLMLCGGMQGNRNSVNVSSMDTAQVFNGRDSFEVPFGGPEELTAGCTVFSMYGSSLYNITLVFKDQETWGLVQYEAGWRRYKISDIGCTAPLTLCTVVVPPEEGQQAANRSFAIWATSSGVYTSDGRHPIEVSHDIRDLFKQNSTVHINLDLVKYFSGYVDKNEMEYHFFFTDSEGDEREYVLDLRRWKWFEIVRGAALKCATEAVDAYGNPHYYGFIDTGYCERLEYGNTFDGSDIDCELHLGDFPLGDAFVESSLVALCPVLSTKTSDVTLTHYLDGKTTGTDYTFAQSRTGYNHAAPVQVMNSVPAAFHSIKFTISINDDSCGFEPFVVGYYHHPIREHDYYLEF